MFNWQYFRRELKISEGSVPTMYLDTVGKVTVGVGNILPNVAAAAKLSFVVRTSKESASQDEIKSGL